MQLFRESSLFCEQSKKNIIFAPKAKLGGVSTIKLNTFIYCITLNLHYFCGNNDTIWKENSTISI